MRTAGAGIEVAAASPTGCVRRVVPALQTLALRVAAPLALGALLDWALLAMTGFGVRGGAPLRNVLLPPFILLVVWNAGVTIGGALRERNSRRTGEATHGV